MTTQTSLAITIAFAIGADAFAGVGTVTLTPARDNTIYAESGERSNGQGAWLFSGSTKGQVQRRALLGFDFADIPAGSTVTDVRLVLFMDRTVAGNVDTSLHRALADWGEGDSDAPGSEGRGDFAAPGDATWTNNVFGATVWDTPGGDFDASGSATQTVGSFGVYEWSGAGLVDDVQAWVDGTLPNHGWFLKADDEGIIPGAKRFRSSENVDDANRPRLVISYVPSPATAVPFVALSALGARRRARTSITPRA